MKRGGEHWGAWRVCGVNNSVGRGYAASNQWWLMVSRRFWFGAGQRCGGGGSDGDGNANSNHTPSILNPCPFFCPFVLYLSPSPEHTSNLNVFSDLTTQSRVHPSSRKRVDRWAVARAKIMVLATTPLKTRATQISPFFFVSLDGSTLASFPTLF